MRSLAKDIRKPVPIADNNIKLSDAKRSLWYRVVLLSIAAGTYTLFNGIMGHYANAGYFSRTWAITYISILFPLSWIFIYLGTVFLNSVLWHYVDYRALRRGSDGEKVTGSSGGGRPAASGTIEHARRMPYLPGMPGSDREDINPPLPLPHRRR